jgi:hypothetical protein
MDSLEAWLEFRRTERLSPDPPCDECGGLADGDQYDCGGETFFLCEACARKLLSDE